MHVRRIEFDFEHCTINVLNVSITRDQNRGAIEGGLGNYVGVMNFLHGDDAFFSQFITDLLNNPVPHRNAINRKKSPWVQDARNRLCRAPFFPVLAKVNNLV